MTSEEIVFLLASIPDINEIEGKKHFGNFPSVMEDGLRSVDHYSIEFEIGGSALYIIDEDITTDSIKVFKKMGGDVKFYKQYPVRFYEHQ